MLFVLKFFLYFTLSFVILSVPIEKKPVFFYLHEWVKPYMGDFYESFSKIDNSLLKKGKILGEKIFHEPYPQKDQSLLPSLEKPSHSVYYGPQKRP